MSGAATPARHLLSLLEDEQALETLPDDEVRADLEAFGIDPAEPIRLARGLAERRSGPAATLLTAVIEDEAADAEIAALETAKIDDVRDKLEAGTVAAVTAEAHLRTGQDTNIVGLSWHRRRAVWAWAGSLVGVAACVLIVVAVWLPPATRMPAPEAVEVVPPMVAELRAEPPAAADRPEASADSANLASQASGESVGRIALAEPEPTAALEDVAPDGPIAAPLPPAMPSGRRADPVDLAQAPPLPPPVPAERQPLAETVASAPPLPPPIPAARRAPPVTAVALAPTVEAEADQADDRDDVPAPAQQPTRSDTVALSTPVATQAGEQPRAPATDQPEEPTVSADLRSDAGSAPVAGPEDRARSADVGSLMAGAVARPQPTRGAPVITAFLVVDPGYAPLFQPFFATDIGADSSESQLTARLGEARSIAGGQQVVGLAGLRQGEEAYDVAIVLRAIGVDAEPLARPLANLYGQGAVRLAQIRLPPR